VIGAVAAVNPERSLAEAKAADRRLRAGAGRALEGVPFTVKDWIDVAGWPVSGATGTDRGCPDRRPARDATAVARMRAAGAVVLGISRAMADSAAHGPTRNPRDPSRAPGRFLLGCRRPGRLGCVPAGAGQIAGPDGMDGGMPPVPLGDLDAVDVAALRVGFLGAEPTGPALAALAEAGAVVRADPLPDVRAEALELTRRYWSRAQLSGAENVRVLWDWDRFRRRWLAATAGLDIVITPVATEPAPAWRESVDTDYRWTLPWSPTGAPVVVVPVGTDRGLPVAVQVVAQLWADHVALAAARCIEAAVPPVVAEPTG